MASERHEISSESASTILKMLCDSEISFRITALWDTGYMVELGNEVDGFKCCVGCIDTFEQAIFVLAKETIKYYPDSRFSEFWATKLYESIIRN